MFDPRFHGDVDARGAWLDFAVNVAPSTPPWLQGALRQAVERLRDYPDPAEAAEVRAMIAEYHGIDYHRIALCSGAAEAFSWLPKLRPMAPCTIHPGFSEPDAVFGGATTQHLLPAPFKKLSAPEHADMVILGNPTNPTGVVHDASLLRAPGRTLVVDEAFMDIVGEEHSLIPQELVDVLCLRSLTKTWGIAGLRVGYAVGEPALLERLQDARPHWPVGTLQLAGMRAVFEHGVGQLEAIREQVEAERTAMLARLEGVGFVAASESKAPFVLLRTPFARPEEVRQALRARGIAVRRCDTFAGLDLNHWRLAVKPMADVEALIANLHEIGALE